MIRQRAFAVACAATATTVLGLVAAPSQAITLQPGQSLNLGVLAATQDSFTVGDKQFSGFDCNIVKGGNQLVTPFTCNDIEVRGIFGPNFGFQLQSAFGAINTSLIDVLVEYMVESLDPGKLISDAHLFFNGAGNPPGFFLTNVTETFQNAAGDVVGQIKVTNPPEFLQDSIDFISPVRKLNVRKDIGLSAFVTPSQANISFVDQTFSQTPTSVPEPSAMGGLLVFGSLGIGAMLKRQRQQSNKLALSATPNDSGN